jgi:WD40 repeat protein
MTARRLSLACCFCALLAGPASAVGPPPRHVDRRGDLLPSGALARLGTGRLFHRGATWLAFSPDGKALASAGETDVRVWEVRTGRLLWRRKHPLFAGYDWGWSPLEFSPDGKLLAVGSSDGSARLWDVETGGESYAVRLDARPLTNRRDARPVTTVVFSPDGPRLAAGGEDAPVHLIDAETGKVIRRWGPFHSVETLAFTANGKSLVALVHGPNLKDATRYHWDTQTGHELRRVKLPDDRGYHGRLSSDSRLLALVGLTSGAGLGLRDTRTGKDLPVGPGRADGFCQPAFSQDGKQVAGCGSNGVVSVWETAGGKRLHRLDSKARRRLRAVALSRDGGLLALAGEGDDVLHVWDPQRGKELHPFEGHRDGPLAAIFSADGKAVVTASRESGVSRTPVREWRDLLVCRWEAASGRPLGVRRADPGGDLRASVFVPGGDRLLTLIHEGTLRLWDTRSGKQLSSWKGPIRNITHRVPAKGIVTLFPTPGISNPRFSPDGKTILAKGAKALHRWEAATGKELPPLGKGKLDYFPPLICPDGRALIEVTWDTDRRRDQSLIVVRDAASGRTLRQSSTGGRLYPPMAVSPNGRTVAARDWLSVRLFEVAGGGERGRIEVSGGVGTAVAFSPDGRLLLIGSTAGEILIHDPADGALLRRLKGGHEGGVTTLVFSPEGGRLLSAGDDNVAMLWDLTGLPPRRRSAAFRFSPTEWAELWADLSGPSAAKAHRAIWRLARAPRQSPKLVKGRLERLMASDPKKLARLIADLDAEAFEVRQRARLGLAELGWAAEAAMRKALADSTSVEVQHQLKALIKKLERSGAPSAEVVALRAVEVLEYAGGAEARETLEGLARGKYSAPIQEEARLALKRLAGR